MLSKFPPSSFTNIGATKSCILFSSILSTSHSTSLLRNLRFPVYYSTSSPVGDANDMCMKRKKHRWTHVEPDISEEQKVKISKLPLKMSNRCKALMKHIICFSSEDDLYQLLSAWVNSMKPRRADWLNVLKEIERIEDPIITEVMEFALLEDSFEAHLRDYTKLIYIYGKLKQVQNAERVLHSMIDRGLQCDQVVLSVFIDMYSKSGDLSRAKKAFDSIKSLGMALDRRSYGSMIMAYIRANMLKDAEGLLKEVEVHEVYAGKEIYKALLRAYSIVGDSDGAQRIFAAIQFAGIVPDDKLCALLVNAYCTAQQIEKARTVIWNMKLVGLQPSDKCVSLVLHAYEKDGNLEDALAFSIELEKDGIVLAQEASEVLARWFCKLGVIREVDEVLREYCTKTKD